MSHYIGSHNLQQMRHIFDNARPQLTFFGGRYTSGGEELAELTKKVERCAQEWMQLSCEDRFIGLQLQRSIKDFYVQIERDLPKYNILTRFFAYIRMFELSFIHFRPGAGLYIFPEFSNKIDLFNRSLDWRSPSNFCVFTEDQLRTSFPLLWAEWQEGDQSKIKKEAEGYSLDPNYLFSKLSVK